jgi:hypothetical protein
LSGTTSAQPGVVNTFTADRVGLRAYLGTVRLGALSGRGPTASDARLLGGGFGNPRAPRRIARLEQREILPLQLG